MGKARDQGTGAGLPSKRGGHAVPSGDGAEPRAKRDAVAGWMVLTGADVTLSPEAEAALDDEPAEAAKDVAAGDADPPAKP